MKILIKIVINIFDKLGYSITILKKSKYEITPSQKLEIYSNGNVGI